MATSGKQKPGWLPGRVLYLDVCTLFRPVCPGELLCVDGLDLRATDQLDIRHRRIVAGTETALEDTQVTAGTLAVTRAQLDEQLADRFLVTQARERKAAIGNTVGLRERDQRLRHAAQFLRLGQGGT